MEISQLLTAYTRQGLAIAHHALAHGLDGLDVAGSTTRQLMSIGREFYGPCREKRLRARVVELAEDFSVDRLSVIVKYPNQLRKGAAMTPWELRVELAERTEGVDKLAAYAIQRVRELNATAGTRAPRSLVIAHQPDATGRRTALLKLPAEEMAAFERKLRSMIRGRGTLPEDIAMGDAAWTLLTTGTGVETRGLEPTVLIKAEDLIGCGDGWLQATDGTRLRAAEYMRTQLGRHGWALLYDANNQPVDLWRTQRLANEKQRQIIAADQGTCAWPGCNRNALYGQAHHVTAWEDGGNTNQANLMGLCGPHNAMNGRNGRGTMERGPQGETMWKPPDGGPPLDTTNQDFGRAWALRQLDNV